MIDMTGSWKFGGPGGFTIPHTTIKLDLFSDGTRDFYEGLFGQSASGGEPILPVEPDGGIGDGAGPIPLDDPIPVEPDGGIGDGAGPIGDGGDDGVVTILPYPLPVDADGGIGDGAGPPPDLEPGEGVTIDGGGEGTKDDDVFIASEDADTFVFLEGHGVDTILGFDIANDRLDFSGSEIDFTDLESLLAHTADYLSIGGETAVSGVFIETGDGTGVYLEGITSADLASATINF